MAEVSNSKVDPIQKDLGRVTAYAYAVAGGYTGTEAQFIEDFASMMNGGGGYGLNDEQSALLREMGLVDRASHSLIGGKEWGLDEAISILADDNARIIAPGDYIIEPDNEGNNVEWVVAHRYATASPQSLILVANQTYKKYSVEYGAPWHSGDLSKKFGSLLDEEFSLRCNDNMAKHAQRNTLREHNLFRDPSSFYVNGSVSSKMMLPMANQLLLSTATAGYYDDEEKIENHDVYYYYGRRSNAWRFGVDPTTASTSQPYMFNPYVDTFRLFRYASYYLTRKPEINIMNHYIDEAYFSSSYRERTGGPIVVNGNYAFAHSYDIKDGENYSGTATNYILPCIQLVPIEIK